MLHSADGTILIRAVSHPSSHFDVTGLVQTRRGDSRKVITFPLSRRPTNICVMVRLWLVVVGVMVVVFVVDLVGVVVMWWLLWQ